MGDVLVQDLRLRPKLSNNKFVYILTFWNSFNHHEAVVVEKKTISMAVNFDLDILAFFILGDEGVFQCLDCRLVSTSYWNIQVSLLVMMFSINSGSTSNIDSLLMFFVTHCYQPEKNLRSFLTSVEKILLK